MLPWYAPWEVLDSTNVLIYLIINLLKINSDGYDSSRNGRPKSLPWHLREHQPTSGDWFVGSSRKFQCNAVLY